MKGQRYWSLLDIIVKFMQIILCFGPLNDMLGKYRLLIKKDNQESSKRSKILTWLELN